MDIYQFIPLIEELRKIPLWSNWYLKERIGAGAFSFVYTAEAKRYNRTDYSAVKIEPIVSDIPNLDEEQQIRQCNKKIIAHENESEIMYKLKDCPYIVGYEEEFCQEFRYKNHFGGYLFLIRMELLDSVTGLIRENKMDFSEAHIIKFALNIGQGIKAVHDLGYIHRDIKIDNFFRSPKSNLYKIGDFNISKKSETAYTRAGTSEYIAPEVYNSGMNTSAYTRKVDIYSFGIALYKLMNDMYFPLMREYGSKEESIIRRISGEPFPKPQNASDEFSRIIMKACAYKPENRYENIDEMLADLNALSEITPTAGEPAVTNTETNKSDNEFFLTDVEDITDNADITYIAKIADAAAAENDDQDDRTAFRTTAPEEYTELDILKRRADSGDLEAQKELGNARAQYNLGTCYAQGTGVPENQDEALKWFKCAAEQGNVPAQKALGQYYQRTKNYK